MNQSSMTPKKKKYRRLYEALEREKKCVDWADKSCIPVNHFLYSLSLSASFKGICEPVRIASTGSWIPLKGAIVEKSHLIQSLMGLFPDNVSLISSLFIVWE